MKTLYLFLLTFLLTCFPMYGQSTQRAKELLDRTSTALSENSGIKASFLLKNYRAGSVTGQTEGTIQLKGNRFVLETPGTMTWFNGKTQWTYVADNEEINVSNPTEEELQSINPYSFINLYKKGFSYRTEGVVTHSGKSAQKMVLTPDNKQQDITRIELLIEPKECRLLFIRVCSGKGEEMTVDVRTYQSDLRLNDNFFTPDMRRYPHAEIIDLR